jgi:uncharacterized protein (TIGR03067 family)
MCPAVMVLVGLMLVDTPADEAAKKDQTSLRAVWSVVSLEADGTKVPDEAIRGLRYEFRGDKLTIAPAEPSSDSEFSYRLNPTTNPAAIDMTVTRGRNRGKVYPGIYGLRGDDLKICFAKKDRPAAFVTKEGSGTAMVVLKRTKR